MLTVCMQGMFRRGLQLEALKGGVHPGSGRLQSVLQGKSDKGVRQLKVREAEVARLFSCRACFGEGEGRKFTDECLRR
jgi:hypothetical protein